MHGRLRGAGGLASLGVPYLAISPKEGGMELRRVLIASVLLLSPEFCKPQQEVAKMEEVSNSVTSNSVYVEMLGNAIFASVNYDCLFEDGFGIRVGIGASGFDRKDGVSIPISANYVIGRTHCVEFGLGVEFMGRDSELHPLSVVGYRYQRNDGGMFYRLSLSPLIFVDEVSGFGFTDLDHASSISFSVGYSF